MARNGMSQGNSRLFIIAAVAVASVLSISTTQVQAGVEQQIVLQDEQPVTWPNFYDGMSQQKPALEPPYIWTPDSQARSATVVSAPLPPAVATGLFILGANWFATRLWKKRKI